MHFSTLFGLELDYLKLKDPDSFKTLTVEFHNASVSDKSDRLLSSSPKTSQNNTLTNTPPCTTGTSQPSSQTKFSRLSEEDKAGVEWTIDGLPKSYLLKQCRTDLKKSCIIKSTPGKAPGAQHSFRQLLTDQVQQMVGTYMYLACL